MAGAARHLLISGPMGTGKSTVGRLVADRLSLPFTDLDADVEAQAGCSVAALFAREGEAGFRVRERRALEAALAGPAAVIALGGGTIVDPENRHLIRQHGRLVTLTASLETLAERLAGDTTRPLLAGGIEALADLVAVRSVAYADADVVVATDGRDPEAVAAAVVAAWRGGCLMAADLALELPGGGYPILVRHEAVAECAARVAEIAGAASVIVISDETVWALHGPTLLGALGAVGVQAAPLTVPPGEAAKDLAIVARLYDEAFAAGVDRGTILVAFGGGVVGDVAGFVAATLLRGLRFVQVPTTLLAQVDSSVGGKVGVNHARGKNLIGAFHQPALVFADTAWLRTLPPRSLRAGLAEVVKHGLVARPALLAEAPAALRAWERGEPEAMALLVASAIEVKAEVVRGDVFEAGQRALLNLGHTLGHAIEAAHPGVLEHGEAVALGIACAAERSEVRGLVSPAERQVVLETLAACGLDTAWRPWISPSVLDKVANDKKIRGQYVNDVLLSGLGRCQIDSVTLAAWRRTVTGLAADPVEA